MKQSWLSAKAVQNLDILPSRFCFSKYNLVISGFGKTYRTMQLNINTLIMINATDPQGCWIMLQASKSLTKKWQISQYNSCLQSTEDDQENWPQTNLDKSQTSSSIVSLAPSIFFGLKWRPRTTLNNWRHFFPWK